MEVRFSLIVMVVAFAAVAAPEENRYQKCLEAVRLIVQATYEKESEIQLWEGFHVALACGGLSGNSKIKTNWKASLPVCPAKFDDAKNWSNDWARSVSSYHPGAHRCVRKASEVTWEKLKEYSDYFHPQVKALLKSYSPGQQCCYDERGDQIRSGVAAGTPDVVSPTEQWGLSALDAATMHYRLDVRIIDARLHWPDQVDVYHALGWLPSSGPRLPRIGPNLTIIWEEL